MPHIRMACSSICEFAHFSAYGQACTAAAKAIHGSCARHSHRSMPLLREAVHTRAASAGVGCNCFGTAFLLAAIHPAVYETSAADLALRRCAVMTSLRAT